MEMLSRIPKTLVHLLLAVAAAAIASPALAQNKPQAPAELVRAAINNEVAAQNGSMKHLFFDHKKTLQGSQTRVYVETKEAMAGMTIAYNDKPLDQQQLQAEQGRLAGLAGNPEQLKRKQREQRDEADRTMRILKAMPDAFVFEYDGTQTGSSEIGKDGVALVRLKFHPRPSYQPPSHVEEVLTGMDGTLLIDPEAKRLAAIDGVLIKEVSFGWGILGHLDKGGRFVVHQVNVGDGCWEMSRMSLIFTGKILMFKKLNINSEEVFSNFRRVPDNTTFAQGVEMLKTEQARLAQGGTERASADSSR
jgi:hypothetical protein